VSATVGKNSQPPWTVTEQGGNRQGRKTNASKGEGCAEQRNLMGIRESCISTMCYSLKSIGDQLGDRVRERADKRGEDTFWRAKTGSDVVKKQHKQESRICPQRDSIRE